MRLHVGTSGYAYKEWLGAFYPAKLPAARMLASYAERLRTVEANNTFYRMPAPGLLARWAGEVPADFTFAVKAPQRITHIARLRDVEDATRQFLAAADELGAKLGPLFFQTPPNFRQDLTRLAGLAAVLASERRVALELRHPSWHEDAAVAALRGRGWVLVTADDDDDAAPAPIVATGGWGYLRLRRAGYDRDALRGWVERIRAQPWSDAYVYFKHEDTGSGPRFALALQELWHE